MSQALCLVRVCLVEVSLEVVYMGFLAGMLASGGKREQEGFVYPFLTTSVNSQRLWILLEIFRAVSRAQHARQALVRPCVLRLWLLSLYVASMWYFVLAVHAEDTWVAVTLSGLTVINGILCFLWLYLLTTPSALSVPRIELKTFNYETTAGAESPLRFEACCVICLLDLEEGHLVGQLPCGHAFHEHCIRQWLATKNCCPMRCAPPQAAPAGAVEDSSAGAAPPEEASEGGSEAVAEAAAEAVGGEVVATATASSDEAVVAATAAQQPRWAARRAGVGRALGLAGLGEGPPAAPQESAPSRAPLPGSELSLEPV